MLYLTPFGVTHRTVGSGLPMTLHDSVRFDRSLTRWLLGPSRILAAAKQLHLPLRHVLHWKYGFYLSRADNTKRRVEKYSAEKVNYNQISRRRWKKKFSVRLWACVRAVKHEFLNRNNIDLRRGWEKLTVNNFKLMVTPLVDWRE